MYFLKKPFLVVTLSNLFLSTLSLANLIEIGQTETTVVEYQPRFEVDSSEQLAKEMAEHATDLFMRELEKLRQKGKITSKMFDDNDKENLILNRSNLHKNLSGLISKINAAYQERREQIGGESSAYDLIPKSYLVFLGGKINGSLSKKLKYLSTGSFNIACVFTPVTKKTINVKKVLEQGEEVIIKEVIKTESDFLWDIVFWPHADILDLGVKSERQKLSRLGVGLIWDLKDQMLQPKDFQGVTLSASMTSRPLMSYVSKLIPSDGVKNFFNATATDKAGKSHNLFNASTNLKIGVLYKTSTMTDVSKMINKNARQIDVGPDFAFLTASKSFNSNGEAVKQVNLKGNISAVMSFDNLIGIGFTALNGIWKGLPKLIQRDVNTIVSEQSGVTVKTPTPKKKITPGKKIGKPGVFTVEETSKE